MADVILSVFSPLVSGIFGLIKFILCFAVGVILCALIYFFVRYRINPFRPSLQRLRALDVQGKWLDLFRWVLVDFIDRRAHKEEFKPFGFTFFVGPQGTGKTISLVHYLDEMKARYPHCIIVTNFQYEKADFLMEDWQDIMNVRNGNSGVIFAIDEIQSEYSSASWKDVPEDLLSEVSQQRKQRVKIVATAQFFTRVAKPLREQASTVVVCNTHFGRLTTNREYDALRYSMVLDNPNIVKKKLRPRAKSSFIQTDALRQEYDTYEKIKRMRGRKFIPRNERA